MLSTFRSTAAVAERPKRPIKLLSEHGDGGVPRCTGRRLAAGLLLMSSHHSRGHAQRSPERPDECHMGLGGRCARACCSQVMCVAPRRRFTAAGAESSATSTVLGARCSRTCAAAFPAPWSRTLSSPRTGRVRLKGAPPATGSALCDPLPRSKGQDPRQGCWGRVRCEGAGSGGSWAALGRARAQASPRSLRI